MGVNNLPRVATQQCAGRESNLQSLDHESSALPGYHYTTELRRAMRCAVLRGSTDLHRCSAVKSKSMERQHQQFHFRVTLGFPAITPSFWNKVYYLL